MAAWRRLVRGAQNGSVAARTVAASSWVSHPVTRTSELPGTSVSHNPRLCQARRSARSNSTNARFSASSGATTSKIRCPSRPNSFGPNDAASPTRCSSPALRCSTGSFSTASVITLTCSTFTAPAASAAAVGDPASGSTARASFTNRDAAPPDIRYRSRSHATVPVAPNSAATPNVSTCRTSASCIAATCCTTTLSSSTQDTISSRDNPNTAGDGHSSSALRITARISLTPTT